MAEKIIKAIFSPRKDELLKQYIVPGETVLIKNKSTECSLDGCIIVDFEWVSRNYSTCLEMIKDKLVILYDIDRLYKYDTTLTRFFVNIASKETNRKIVCGNSLIKNNNYDIFSYYYFLDRKIIGVNHYWCFKANHMEQSKFDMQPVRMLDSQYLARKVKDVTVFEIEPKNELEEALKNEIVSAERCLRDGVGETA